jgi:predicted site-specific integrase-resolvase
MTKKKTLKRQKSLLNRNEACEMLSCSIQTLRRLEKAGKLTPVKGIDSWVRYRLSELEKLTKG